MNLSECFPKFLKFKFQNSKEINLIDNATSVYCKLRSWITSLIFRIDIKRTISQIHLKNENDMKFWLCESLAPGKI